MNPSNFPQVIRSRSRSPSPVSRRRVGGNSGEQDHGGDGETDCFCSERGRSATVRIREHYKGENQLSLPDASDGQRLRSVSAGDRRVSPRRTLPRGGVAELENMANVNMATNHRHITINDADIHTVSDQGGDPTSDHGPAVIHTTHHRMRHHSHHTAHTTHTSGQGDSSSRQGYGSTENNFGNWTPNQVDQLRRRVKFFFMDPCSKFKARRHMPWKLILQVIKIIVITIQLVQFGGQRSEIVEYFERNQRALEHLLLKDWDPSYETMPYPAATGDYALYSTDDLLDHIDFAWAQYHNLSQSSLATMNLIKEKGHNLTVPMRLCNSFDNYDDFHNGSYVVGSGVLNNCTDLIPLNNTEDNNPFNIRAFLQQENITIPFLKLLELTLEFSFTTFHLNLIENHYGPTCYIVNATILFNNYERSGQVLIHLLTKRTERTCSGKIMTPSAKDEEDRVKLRSVVFDSSVIIICAFSIILCSRSLLRGWKLKRKVEKLFRQRFGKKLEFTDRMEFVNLWYFLIIINDVFTISGAAYKIQLETRTVTITSHNYDWCSLMLGLGGLMAWIGCLRYLGFFKKYNILILTLKKAFPNVLRFLVCTLAIYFGFMFCGWVILGPYHIKFRSLSSTSECLYSLVNGDDMFVTFSATQTENVVVWYFSRTYLYIFISLFIYCVLSLFIAVIMDTYETLKDHYEHGFPKTDLQLFIEECNTPIKSGLFRRQHTESEVTTECSLFDCLSACCKKRRGRKDAGERSQLLTQTI